MREEKMNNRRGREKTPRHSEPTTHEATGAGQVWTWDITYLNAEIKGKYHYLYLISDLYSRKIVHWEVYEAENAENASELIQKAVFKEGFLSTKPLVLHSDNGSPMKGATMLETLRRLGITPSRSRPRVSNDNAFAESLFKTLKYRPNYQPKGFDTIENARLWVANFVRWYNFEHHHSGIKFLTPNQRHSGKSEAILLARKTVYEAAKAKYPNRWKGRATRNWELSGSAFLNPVKEKRFSVA